MSSKITICNMALRKLGLESIQSLDPPLTNQRQRDCDLYYDQAVGTVLRVAPWIWARKRRALASFPVPDAYTGVAKYAYMYPADCAKLLKVTTQYDTKKVYNDVMRAGTLEKVIFTQIQYAYAVYTQLVTDPTWFDEDFVEATALKLSAYLAGPLRASDDKVQLAAAQYEVAVAQAQKNNRMEDYREPDKSDTWLKSRY